MNQARIRELERSARLVREVLVLITDEELVRVNAIIQNAGFAAAMETYSRIRENQGTQEPALV